jgi:glycosyltransferase involved in cell wall biosynthesis
MTRAPDAHARLIVHVIDYGGTTGGSFIPALASLACAVRERGERFAVVATEIPGASWPQELSSAGAELHFVSGAAAAVAVLRELRAAIIHAHFTRYDLASVIGGGRARIFWHLHSDREPEAFSVRRQVRDLVKQRLVGARVEAVVAVSNALAREALAWHVPARKLKVVHNGIDLTHFRPPLPAERAAARRAFGLADSDRVVAFFDRVPYKGGETLAAAMVANPNLRLLVAGVQHERFAQLPGLIAAGRAGDTRDVYWAADLLAFPSTREAFGLVLIEALACGLPVVASDIPVVGELCEGIAAVTLFRNRDSADLASALARVARQSPSGEPDVRVGERFGLDRWTREILALYA